MADKKNLNDKSKDIINEAELDKVTGGNSAEADSTIVGKDAQPWEKVYNQLDEETAKANAEQEAVVKKWSERYKKIETK